MSIKGLSNPYINMNIKEIRVNKFKTYVPTQKRRRMMMKVPSTWVLLFQQHLKKIQGELQ
jgi:hypothetical protein